MKKVTMIALSLFVAVAVFAACGTNGGSLNDGTYTGEGAGHNGPIEVSVTISNGTISSVEALNHEETESQWNEAWNSISAAVIGEDSVEDIDLVTGATVSSEGILEAIQNAIDQAN